jgi:putative ABC transport system substrate-binding protein
MKKTLRSIFAAACAVLVGVCATACAPAAKKVKVNPDKEHYVVGICQIVQHVALDAATQGFRDSLAAELEAEGRTVEFDEQNAQGEPTICSTIVNNFVAADVDLIMANATPSLQAAYNATETIPVLGTSITEYSVALSLKNYNGTVGGNVSGTSDLAPLDAQADMITDLVPSANKIGLIYCSAEANSDYQVKKVKKALQDKGKTVNLYPFSDANDIATVVTSAYNACDALYVPTDNTAASNTEIIRNICYPTTGKVVPVIAGEEGICRGCGIASLSINYYSLGVKTGKMAAEVLLGKKSISTMAVAYDENPTYVYNPELCEKAGITVPSTYQALTQN